MVVNCLSNFTVNLKIVCIACKKDKVNVKFLVKTLGLIAGNLVILSLNT